MSKVIILCADDFSLNPAINAGILSLLELGRLTAVSCMTQSPTWIDDAKTLAVWRDQADIGLHFNLTQHFPGSYTLPLSHLMLQSHLQLLSKQKIRNSFCRQLDAFETALQHAPDFIDGHQHVHIFPVVRDVLIKEYNQRYGQSLHKKPYIRSLEHMPADQHNIKANILRWSGAKQHAQLLKQNRIPCNRAFGGIYDFNPDENLDTRMQRWLNLLADNSLIMCHPATDEAEYFSDDPIAAARCNEYRYLASMNFAKTLQQQHVVLARANNTA